MNYNRIRQLANGIPVDDPYFTEALGTMANSFQAGDGIHNLNLNQPAAIIRKSTTYLDIRFGYNFVNFLVRTKTQAPPLGKNPWVLAAYKYKKRNRDKNSDKHERHSRHDEVIVDAMTLDDPSHYAVASAVQAYLACRDITLEKIAEELHMNIAVLNAYQELFFNFRDRRDEVTFTTAILYPKTRIEEARSGYADNKENRELLLLAADKNGVDHVRYFLGVNSEAINQSSADASQKIETLYTQEALMMASNGFSNQSNNHVLRVARSFITADKVAGSGQDTEDELSASVGTAIVHSLDHYKESGYEKQIIDSRK